MAETVSSALSANTSATPVALGTAGTMDWTPLPSPGLLHTAVPTGSAPAQTVTSADPVPAVTVTCPAASAVSTGGSSVDRLTTVWSLDFHVSPVTACPPALSAWIVCVSPTNVQQARHERVPARRRNREPQRVAPQPVAALNPRDAAHRSGGHRGGHLRVAPLLHLPGHAAQGNIALRRPEARTGKRDQGSGHPRRRADARNLRRVHGE